MTFPAFDPAGVARSLAAVGGREDHVDAFFELTRTVSLAEDGRSRLRIRTEEGLAVRLLEARGGRTWLSSHDAVSGDVLELAIRQVARSLPSVRPRTPSLGGGSWPAFAAQEAERLRGFAERVEDCLRDRHLGIPLQVEVELRERWVQCVCPGLVPDPQEERYYGVRVTTGLGSFGGIATELDDALAERLARRIAERFRAREAPSVETGPHDLLLGPDATAVLLHEAVSHLLEADVLAVTGHPEAALGVEIGPSFLDVLDSPANAPEGVRRSCDDEGTPVERRWLVKKGRVHDVLADRRWASESDRLAPGSGWRADRHSPLRPWGRHLELPPGEADPQDLQRQIDRGLWVPTIRRGRLDALTGRFELEVPAARRIRAGERQDRVGGFVAGGSVLSMLSSVAGVGSDARPAGAGWCAKGGQRQPVWATCPSLLLRDVEITDGSAGEA